MYNESLLISRIQTLTGYSTTYAEEATLDSASLLETTAPKVYVGHRGIKLKYPDQLWANGYTEFDNPQILITDILFLCERLTLDTVRTNIYNAYIGFTPFPNDSDFSSLVFIESNVLVKTRTKIWVQEVVGLIFPRIS
jgi:hypothetical protein